MKMMIRRVIDFGLQAWETGTTTGTVASGTNVIALPLQLRRMRGMTITTGHTGVMHFALDEGTVDKYLIQDLAIGKVKTLVQQRGHIVVEQLRTGTKSFRYLVASAMTGSANIQSNFGILQRYHTELAWTFAVRGAGSMTGLTADADFSELGGIGICRRVEALGYRRGMTIGAHVVPVLA